MVVFKTSVSMVSVVFVAPRNTGIYSIKRGWFSNFISWDRALSFCSLVFFFGVFLAGDFLGLLGCFLFVFQGF